jgi:hypothetical protein
VVIDECGNFLQLEGDKGVRRGRLIEKNGGPGRRSPTKADGGAVRTKSHAGRSPLVASDGQEVGGGGVREVWAAEKMRERGGDEGVRW